MTESDKGVSFGEHFNGIIYEHFLCLEHFVVVRNNYFWDAIISIPDRKYIF